MKNDAPMIKLRIPPALAEIYMKLSDYYLVKHVENNSQTIERILPANSKYLSLYCVVTSTWNVLKYSLKYACSLKSKVIDNG